MHFGLGTLELLLILAGQKGRCQLAGTFLQPLLTLIPGRRARQLLTLALFVEPEDQAALVVKLVAAIGHGDGIELALLEVVAAVTLPLTALVEDGHLDDDGKRIHPGRHIQAVDGIDKRIQRGAGGLVHGSQLLGQIGSHGNTTQHTDARQQ